MQGADGGRMVVWNVNKQRQDDFFYNGTVLPMCFHGTNEKSGGIQSRDPVGWGIRVTEKTPGSNVPFINLARFGLCTNHSR